jgi:hypothetical protein
MWTLTFWSVLLASLTERVVRESTIPVLTIPPSAEIRQSDELMPFDPILFRAEQGAEPWPAWPAAAREGLASATPEF